MDKQKIYLLLRKRLRQPIDNCWISSQPKKNDPNESIVKQFSNYTERDVNPDFKSASQFETQNNMYSYFNKRTFTFSSNNPYTRNLVRKRKK